ncbi:hypothetical protein MAR_004888 [Mya arenaria]|uniref:Uncharacterized protein n=1 Tax=Mya arenaria TaxID=6604 RepID=A0ABY7F212_MYAAR|nr:hypothetical protein MAR_004888 [Mya arenaria]
MHIQVEERVFSSIADSSGCLGSALVAGDSNVHRIQAAIPNWSTIRCLPVSAPMMFKPERMRVTEVCDSIHETSPETEIVLCSILPRKKNDRRVSSTLARVFNRWIQNANTMLMDISEAIPYIRFLGYGAQDRITFPSLDDWLEYLPEKRIDPETTDLRFCPKHLRSKLKLLLFDEDYLDMPTNKSYTMSDHLCTLDLENLNAVQCEVLEIPALERPSKKRKSTASVKVTKDVEPLSVMQESKKSMYEQFSIDLIEDGKIYIQVAEEDTMICCMNDYNDSGSLRKEVYVYTTWLKQESGDYFHCTCSIYRTLFDIAHSQTLNYSNRNSCMHCTFLKCIVLPNLQIDERATETKTRKFVQEGKQCAGKDLIELSDFNGTRKFSVLAEGETKPVFLSLSHNKAKANYTVTCHNGECQSKKGHKRYLNNLNSSNLCRHLFVLKHNPESWIDLHERNATNETFLDDQLLDDETNDDAGDGDPVDTNDNFDPETGLWKYKCESSHPAAARESDMLRRNIIKRDGWNDLTLSRQADGSLKGPNFYPDMPDNTCCCGSGWLKRDDDPDYSENGKLIPLGRVLTVYTQFAPVQCDVYKRVCYNPIDDSRCELAWNEGQSESIHVFSSKTAAGDEIGWEFTSSVMKTGCTFSAYCQMKDELYRTRDPKAKFMDATTQQTLHRRMDRCYLKNKPGVEKRQMIAYREALDNIARTTALPEEAHQSFQRFTRGMSEFERVAYASVLKMLATTASVTSILNTGLDCRRSMLNNNNILPDDIKLFLVHLTNESLNLPVYAPEDATFQFGTYNPEKLGRAYYFNEHGVKLRNVRKFQIDEDRAGRNNDHDDEAMDFERCRKIYSKNTTISTRHI